jgi:mono/diheme cytochrome c family protein
MKGSIVLGTLGVVGLMGALLFVTINEVDRMQTAERAYDSRAIETGALEFESRCRSCHGPQGKGTPLAPALNTAALFDGSRLAAAGYAGTVDDFVRGTISAGRPVPSAGTNYPQRMPTWGERFGGPLRDDQVDSLVAFVMNWEDRALAEGAAAPELPADQAVGTDITQTLPTGDPARGRTLAEGTLGCAACHTLSTVGPAWAGDATAAGIGLRADVRLDEPGYTGAATTAEHYLLESIVDPNAYLVSGFEANLMPGTFSGRLTPQDAADLIAYMLTFK